MSASNESEGWASYAAEQERHAETIEQLVRLRNGVFRLADVYAVSAQESRCCVDCAANDISDELIALLNSVAAIQGDA